MTFDTIIDGLSVVGAVTQELVDRNPNAIKQAGHRGAVANLLRRQDVRQDFKVLFVYAQVELAPATAFLASMFFSSHSPWP